MITNELVEYIKAQRASGKDDGIIRQSLLSGGGWEHEDVDEALAIAGPNTSAIPKAPQPPQAPRPSVPPVQVMPKTPPTEQAPAASVVPNPAPQSTPASVPAQTPSNQWSSMPGQLTPRQNVMPAQAPAPQASAQPFTQPVHGSQTSSTASRSHKGAIFFVILLLLLIGGGVYAYVTGSLTSLPFLSSGAPYTQENLVSGLLAGVSNIDSVDYKVSMGLRVVEREKGAIPYEVDERALAVRKAKFENDSTRLGDLMNIRNAIDSMNPSSYYGSTGPKKYPASLKELIANKGSSSYSSYYAPQEFDPSGVAYRYTRKADGSGFTLSTTLESQEMIEQIKKNLPDTLVMGDSEGGQTTPLKIEGMTVTLDETTGYFYGGYWREPFLVELTEYTKNAPLNLDFVGAVSGTLEYPKNDTPTDWRSNFTLSGDFDDLSVNVDVEARKVEKDYYFIANKFPSFFYFSMLSPIKGKWVKITTDQATTSEYDYGMIASLGREVKGAERNYKDNREVVTQDLKTIARIVDEEKLFALTSPPSLVDVDGMKAYRYDLQIKKENFLTTMERLLKEFEKDGYSYGLETEEILSFFKTDDNSYTLDYMTRNVFITLWADASGKPVKGEIKFRVVPPASVEHLADKQIEFAIALSLANINNATKVVAPKDFITAEEADDLMNNPFEEARGKGVDASIKSQLSNMRAQAELYYDMNKNSYAGVCASGKSKEGLGLMLTDLNGGAESKTNLQTKIGTTGAYNSITCHDAVNAYAVEAPLSASTAEYPIMYCVDSTGAAAQKTTVLAADQTACRK